MQQHPEGHHCARRDTTDTTLRTTTGTFGPPPTSGRANRAIQKLQHHNHHTTTLRAKTALSKIASRNPRPNGRPSASVLP